VDNGITIYEKLDDKYHNYSALVDTETVMIKDVKLFNDIAFTIGTTQYHIYRDVDTEEIKYVYYLSQTYENNIDVVNYHDNIATIDGKYYLIDLYSNTVTLVTFGENNVINRSTEYDLVNNTFTVGNIRYEIENTTIKAYTMLSVNAGSAFVIGTEQYIINKDSNNTRIISVKDSDSNIINLDEGHEDKSYLENGIRYYVYKHGDTFTFEIFLTENVLTGSITYGLYYNNADNNNQATYKTVSCTNSIIENNKVRCSYTFTQEGDPGNAYNYYIGEIKLTSANKDYVGNAVDNFVLSSSSNKNIDFRNDSPGSDMVGIDKFVLLDNSVPTINEDDPNYVVENINSWLDISGKENHATISSVSSTGYIHTD
jgi:hypothetical protein